MFLRVTGKVVKASSVTEPDDPGPVVVVVEAPTRHHVEALVGCEALRGCANEGGR